MSAVTLIVLAKAPIAGRSKTRLCPPCTPIQAAVLAQAALRDTLAAVAATPVRRRVLVLEGHPGSWLPAGFTVLPQRGEGLDERLAAAFDDVGGPALLVGMDTPQLTPELLAEAIRALDSPGVDAVLGPAEDGGYWAIGLRSAGAHRFLGVPMSEPTTGAAQLARLRDEGLHVRLLQPERDVDHWADAVEVARATPGSHFADAVATVRRSVRSGTAA